MACMFSSPKQHETSMEAKKKLLDCRLFLKGDKEGCQDHGPSSSYAVNEWPWYDGNQLRGTI